MKPLRFLKHVFIPHEHNDYKPHFFREVSVAIILAIGIFLLGVSAGSSFFIHRTVLGANVTASILIDLTNESRLAYNETPLVRNQILDHAAELKAEDMVREQYFAHNSPKGVTPWHWFKEAGYMFLYAGENLAINFTDAVAVRDAWLASPTHRANLLDVKFKEIGMATVQGLYKNDPTIYVVQLFGTPAVAKAETPVATSTVAVNEEESETSFSTSSPTVVLAVNATPEIKGETTEKELYEPVVTTKELAVVKNTEPVEEATTTLPAQTPKEVQTYSTWYERALFGGSYYVHLIYKGLITFVFVALVTMVVIEIRKQHWKHIAYGLALLLALTLCLLINQAFF